MKNVPLLPGRAPDEGVLCSFSWVQHKDDLTNNHDQDRSAHDVEYSSVALAKPGRAHCFAHS